ncbi:hypothetical protein RND81_05G015100 [Saponaria officinalis]|uniref:CCHC-type domain-containing protein n=1 Tax=Saponaria officinalis TaxID=3572 RepID=A0AAW1KT99_SAPOF
MDLFNGKNYRLWSDKIDFLLSQLGVDYTLTKIGAPENNDFSTKKYACNRWLNFRITDDQPVLDQVNEYETLCADIVAELSHVKIEEQNRIQSKGKQVDQSSSNANFAESKNHNKGTRRNNKGPNQIHGVKHQTNFKQKRPFKGDCFTCGESGHFARFCPKGSQGKPRKKPQAHLTEIDEVIAAVVSEVNLVSNSTEWILDTGATSHICSEREAFKEYGKVQLKLSSDKILKLNNVLHVPEIRRNLISGSLLNKACIKLTFETDKLVLTRNNNFDEKGFCNGGLFVLDVMTTNKNSTASVYIAESITLWLARLGHVNVDSIKKLKHLDLIHGFSNTTFDKCETITPYASQQNRIVERKNRTLKDMMNAMLISSGMPTNMWGEAILSACFVLNRLLNLEEAKRARIEKDFGSDFINYLTENVHLDEKDICAYILENDPRTYRESMNTIDSTFWLEAINSEIDSIKSNNTWILTNLPRGCKPLSNKWVFKKKLKLDGSIDKYKARLVVCGNRKTKDGCVIVCLYVDDMLIFGTNMDVINDTKSFLSSRFDMKYLGEADVILGIKITRTKYGLSLDQSHFVEKILKKFDCFDCAPVNSVNQEEYAKIIGSVMFLMNYTRPDITYAVSRLSRYTHSPNQSHWNALLRILKYLRGTMEWGLDYSKTPRVLEGYCDANWVSDNDEIHSTSGYVFTLAGAAISWKSSKQRQEAEWLRNLLEDIPLWGRPGP